MAKQKTTFLLDSNDWLLMEEFTPQQKAEMLTVIFEYAKNYDMPEIIDPFVRQAFKIVKLKMDANLESYQATCKKRKESIAKRWEGDTNVYKCIEEQTKQNADTKDTDMICNDMICNDSDNDVMRSDAHACACAAASPSDGASLTLGDVVELYHRVCVSLPRGDIISPRTKTLIRETLRQHPTADFFVKVFKKAQASDFIRGETGNTSPKDLRWLLEPEHLERILSGFYDKNHCRELPQKKSKQSYSMDGFTMAEDISPQEEAEINAKLGL